MGKSISVLSGIGGSGKTTVSLLLTRLLSNANKKVLYVDCDFSTYGATCFFEKYLNKKDEIFTTEELFFNNNSNHKLKQVLNIEKNIFFVPACTYIPNEHKLNYKTQFNEEVYYNLLNDYDIIIFDCQTGYSEINKQIVKFANKNLIISEANALNSSATRLLYAQLSHELDADNTFQLFNQVTEEEYSLYSCISSDNFLFTNIGSIKQDWKIKKSFITMELMSLDTNPILRNTLNRIIILLFPDFEFDLKKEILDFEYTQKEFYKKQTEIEKISQKMKKTKKILYIFFSILSCVVAVLSVVFIKIQDSIEPLYYFVPILINIVTSMFYCMKNFSSNLDKGENIEVLKDNITKIENNIKYFESNN